MHWSLRCLTSETADTSACLVLEFGSARYMFGCGEGTTRNMGQRRANSKNTRAMFITRVDSESATGLPGFIMSSADNHLTSLDLAGPPPLLHYLATSRRYCFRTDFNLRAKEIQPPPPGVLPAPPRPVFKDENITVYPVLVLPHPRSAETEAGPAPGSLPPASPLSSPGKKRKRDASSERTDDEESTQAREAEALHRSWSLPGFNPTALTGRAAQLWRKLTVASMFSAADDIVEYTYTAAGDVGLPRLKTPTPNPNQNQHPNRQQFLQSLAHSQSELPSSGSRAPYACSYVVVGPQFRGKFLLEKAIKLGVPKGPIRGRITRGETVTLENGTVVTPEMCMDAAPAPVAAVVVECPGVEYVAQLVHAPLLRVGGVPDNVRVHLMVHRVGPGVLEDERYVRWMRGFGDECHHLIANKDYCPNDVSITSSAYLQLRLSSLAPGIFVVPSYSLTPSLALSALPALPALTQPLLAGHTISLHPPGAPYVLNTHKDLFHRVLAGEESADPLPVFAQIQQRVEADVRTAEQGQQPGDDVQVIALGTASALPSKYRNVSSTMIRYPDGRGILLDAGEGTWGQLARHFGVAPSQPNVYSALRDLRLLFLSHVHGDHHMGTARLLAQRRRLSPPPPPLVVVANWNVAGIMREYSRGVEDLGWDDAACVRVLPTEALVDPAIDGPPRHAFPAAEQAAADALLHELRAALDIDELSTTQVLHRAKCHALVLRRRDGFSLAYSADTLPCETLVRAGQAVRLLVHEATFADDERENARLKTHSTAGQAIDVGSRMGAQHTLLTHFSQRYPKMPQLFLDDDAPSPSAPGSPFRAPIGIEGRPSAAEPAPAPFVTRVSCAFDHLQIEVGQLWRMKHYLRGILHALLAMDRAGDTEDPDVPGAGEEQDMSPAQAERVVNRGYKLAEKERRRQKVERATAL